MKGKIRGLAKGVGLRAEKCENELKEYFFKLKYSMISCKLLLAIKKYPYIILSSTQIN